MMERILRGSEPLPRGLGDNSAGFGDFERLGANLEVIIASAPSHPCGTLIEKQCGSRSKGNYVHNFKSDFLISTDWLNCV